MVAIFVPDDAEGKCPECSSSDVMPVNGMYEFTLMRCGDCGHEQWADDHQIWDWYE